MKHKSRSFTVAIELGLVALFSIQLVQGADQRPEIGQLFPDYPVDSPRIITGENFVAGKTQVLCWSPPPVKDFNQLLTAVEDNEVRLPAAPPTGAQQVELLDLENQILVARATAGVTWVKTPNGLSSPYAVDLPRACWMNPSKPRPGETVFMYGFALRVPYHETAVVLRGSGKTIPAKVVNESRGYRDVGPSVYFEIPRDAVAGRYSVFCHNGNGGAIGWRSAGTIEVVTDAIPVEKLISVADFEARGDDEVNDFEGITKAFAAAAAALSERVRPVVYFPPGKWRTDTTLSIPSGVWIRGSSRDLTVIEGYGDKGTHVSTTAVIRPLNHTKIEEVTIKGVTWKGPEAYGDAVVRTTKHPIDVTVQNVRIYAGDYRSSQTTFPYWAGGYYVQGDYIRLLDSEIYGTCEIGGYRVECIGNTIHGGGSRSSQSFVALDCVESLIDCNRIVDSPSRFMVNAKRQTLIRFNEVHPNHRGTYTNSEESFLSHGSYPKDFGHPTAADKNHLTDRSRQWKAHSMQDQLVLITGGRGLGQFRYVTDNTEDTLQLDRDWRIVPDTTSEYVVGTFLAENIWFGNLNLTPGRTSLWRDQIGNLVSHHRDAFGGGIDITSTDRTDVTKMSDPKALDQTRNGFFPAWFNVIDDCWFDGSRVLLGTLASPNNLFKGPVSFGNIIVKNKVRQPHSFRTGFDSRVHLDAGIAVGNRSGTAGGGPLKSSDGEKHWAISHTIVTGNQVSFTNRGISVSDTARKTFLLANDFEAVEDPIIDWSATAVTRGNTQYELDLQGERNVPLLDKRNP